MVLFRLKTLFGHVDLALDVKESTQQGPIIFSGPKKGVELVRRWLDTVMGAYGNFISNYTLNVLIL